MTSVPPEYNFSPARNPRRKLKVWVGLFGILAALYMAFSLVKNLTAREIEVTNETERSAIWKAAAHLFPLGEESKYRKEYIMPSPEKDRLDILVMGVRGDGDADNGGLLTDTMMLFSLDKKTNKASLVSIPRDFYVYINDQLVDKVNSVYERLGVNGTKKLLSKITGVHIDHAVVFDFSSFKKIVDELGGIDITLDKPFEEPTQWGYAFILPEGPNHLDGEQALYYVRSRYSSSDFDRAARQQKVLFAIKDKVLAADFLSDPIKAFSLLTTLRSNIKTDINILDIKDLIGLADQISSSAKSFKRYVLDSENLLYETKLAGIYVLLPRGDSLEVVQKFFKDMPNTLTVPAPTPAPSAASTKP